MDDRRDSDLANLLAAALERAREGYARLDAQGRIAAANPALAEMFGHTAPDALTGRPIADVFIDHERASTERVLTRQVFAAPYDRTHAYALTGVRADHTLFPAEIIFAGNTADGVSQWLVRDLSDEQELERLRLSEERYKRSQSFANIGTWDWIIDSDTLHWSDEVAPMFGLPPGTQPSYSLFCKAVHPDDQKRVRENEIACVEDNQKHDVEYRVVWPGGTIRWLRETGNLLCDDSGKARRMIGVVRDITEQKEEEQHYRHMAYHDPLTGLPNRGLFEQRLDLAIRRALRQETAAALIFVDLGKFKAINDIYGHLTGDKVLVEVGERLKTQIRATDTVARLGGDEFVVLLEGVHDANEVEALAQKLIANLSVPMTIDGVEHAIGVSLGGSVCPGTAHDARSLVQSADMAMYAAKAEGGNTFKMADETSRD